MWCQQVAAWLRPLHELNIVHRNRNPGDVYLDRGGKAKVGGLVCLKESRGPGFGLSFRRCDVGSPIIIAPEVDDGYEVTPATLTVFRLEFLAKDRAKRSALGSRLYKINAPTNLL